MPSNHSLPRRRTIRLANYDYTTSGIYFVTICTHERRPLFDDPALRLIAERQWASLPNRYAHVALDIWIVMPDHLHGFVVLEDETPPKDVPSSHTTRADSAIQSLGLQVQSGSVGAIVRGYKNAVTRRIRGKNSLIDGAIWQRDYYDRVIRDDTELDATRRYIENNPLRASEHRDNLDALFARLQFRQ